MGKGQLEELARLTGIPASNLSSMNTGRLPMTMATAERIAAAVPGLSVLDLGAPSEAAAAEDPPLVLVRLQRVEETIAQIQSRLARLEATRSELSADEAAAVLEVAHSTGSQLGAPPKPRRSRRADQG